MNGAWEGILDRFMLMNAFARSVETGSFSATARELGVGQPNVSRYIAALEEYLGARLLHRSTRKLTLTTEGERYYAEVRRVLDAVTEAESSARGDDQPAGLLRVACPTSIGRAHLLPRIGTLLRRFPQIELDLHITDRYVELVNEGMDLGIRIGALRDSSLITRRIAVSQRVCVASADYLAEHGEPKKPSDLLKHNCIGYTLPHFIDEWIFRDADIQVHGRLKLNTPDAVFAAVLDDLGIGYVPLWLCEKAIRSGKLRILLADQAAPIAPIQVVYPAKRLLPRRARVFLEFITDEFARTPVLTEPGLVELMRELKGTPLRGPKHPRSKA